jgi:hypothetical protein
VCAGPSVIVLHDLRLPGSSANIDHIVVTPDLVFVIDAKRYTGEIRERNYGGLLHTDFRLCIGGRDRSHLVKASLAQAAIVADALPQANAPDVIPVLCFVWSDWPLLSRPLNIDGVIVTWPRALASLVRSQVAGPPADAVATARAIGQRLRPAS